MPVEKVLIQGLWGPRSETVEGIARRWSALNDELAKVDPLLARWVSVTEDEEGCRELELSDQEMLSGLVREGANEIKPELGYGLSAWNRHHGETEAEFRGQAGQSVVASGLVNSARIEAGPESEEEILRWTTIAKPVLLALVHAWQPDCAMVWTHPLRQAQGVRPARPFAGYITYLSARRLRVLPPSLRGVEPTSDGGGVISLLPPSREWPSMEPTTSLGRHLAEAEVLFPVDQE